MSAFRIDSSTFVLLLCAGNAVTSGLFVFCSYPLEADRFSSLFLAGKLLQTIGWGLVLLQSVFPGTVPFQSSMSLMALGIAMDATALGSTRATITRPLILWIAIPALISIANAWLRDWNVSITGAIGAATFTFPYLVAGYLLLTKGEVRSRLAVAIGSVLALCYVAAVAPGVYEILPPAYRVLPGQFLLVSSLGLFYFVMVVSSLGFVLLERENTECVREHIIVELRGALQKVRTLRGLLPICAGCKKIRDDKGYWQHVEVYVRDHADVDFSHGLCPECEVRLYPEFTVDPPA